MSTFDHSSRREVLVAIGGTAILLGLSAQTAFAAPKTTNLPMDDVLSEDAVLRDPDLFVAGNPNGDITIVNYTDYQCPYCRKSDVDLRQVVRDDGKIRLVFKDWPVLGPASVSAAKLVLATKYQDKYIQAHEALITANARLTDDIVRERLAAGGIDVERATRDLEVNKSKIEQILARNDAQAKAFGFRGTPAFIIGKFRVNSPLTTIQFERAVLDARKAAAMVKKT
ncbi:MAG: Twin-arginine translocation pathway signal [Tardiphaga sp.]|jgi:protein-disulfide isomerase|nr:Twin-arginine translocation pathway signal [Tardiphaga sp.]